LAFRSFLHNPTLPLDLLVILAFKNLDFLIVPPTEIFSAVLQMKHQFLLLESPFHLYLRVFDYMFRMMNHFLMLQYSFYGLLI